MIYGQNIRFRSPERNDLPIFVRWLNDPEVRYGIAMFLPMSQAREEEWFENMLKRPATEEGMVIEVRGPGPQGQESWTAIGNCGFMDIDWRNRNAEFGIMIGEKSYWNKGYGTEAVKLLVSHGFQTLNLHRIWLRVFATNPRAIKAYQKAGFTHEGTKRQAEYLDGQYVDVLIMSILRPEWQAAEPDSDLR